MVETGRSTVVSMLIAEFPRLTARTPKPIIRLQLSLLAAAFCRLAGDCHQFPSVI
jgi:hypothetical protein